MVVRMEEQRADLMVVLMAARWDFQKVAGMVDYSAGNLADS